MEKTILYPFSISEENQNAYQKTLELAEQMNAKVICFTRVDKEEDLDDVYLHLLTLHGYYQTTTNDWQAPKVEIQRNIKLGTIEGHLSAYLNATQIDALIKEPSLGERGTAILDAWIKENKKEIQVYSF